MVTAPNREKSEAAPSGTIAASLAAMDGELFLRIIALAQSIRREVREFAKYHGLATTEFLALRQLAMHPYPQTGPSLSRALGCCRAHAKRLLETLVRRGFARSETDRDNPVHTLVWATDEGRELYETAVDALDTKCLAFLSPDDKRNLDLLLAKMQRRRVQVLVID